MSNTITLNFINESNDANNSQIVIFQKDESLHQDNHAIAWQVLNNVPRGGNLPIEYSYNMNLVTVDRQGNELNQPLTVQHGQLFRVHDNASNKVLAYEGPCSEQAEIQVQNDLSQGAIDANIYKDGKLLAKKKKVASGQKAVFKFNPSLWIGVATKPVVEGEVLDSAIMKQINTEISLLGIKSADIVMTGGGPGASSTSFQFNLENVVYE